MPDNDNLYTIPKIPLPSIHLNGTGKITLIHNAREVYRALQVALDFMAAARPHGRNYYPQGPDAITAARDADDALFNTVHTVQTRYLEMVRALDED